jgi:hypothetical protein
MFTQSGTSFELKKGIRRIFPAESSDWGILAACLRVKSAGFHPKGSFSFAFQAKEKAAIVLGRWLRLFESGRLTASFVDSGAFGPAVAKSAARRPDSPNESQKKSKNLKKPRQHLRG